MLKVSVHRVSGADVDTINFNLYLTLHLIFFSDYELQHYIKPFIVQLMRM